jgi:PRTRC genetic system protein C
MSIEVNPIKRVFRYNGIELPDVPGLAPREIRDLYSAQYPELVSAEIEAGEIHNGQQEITFRKAVGVKGTTPEQGQRLAALRQRVQDESEGRCGSNPQFSHALTRRSIQTCAQAWDAFARLNAQRADAPNAVTATSEMLAPLP